MPLVAFISLTALGNIPCTVRDSLKHVAGRSFNFKADGNRYVLDVYKGHNTTVMGGNDWVKFVTDFNLGAGSYVVFDTSKRTAEAYVVHLGFGDFANDGESDEDVEGEGAGVEVFIIESDEDDHEEGDAQEVVYTQGCVLSGVKESLLDVVLANNDGQSPAGFNANEVSSLFSLTMVLMRAGESGTEEANTTGAGLSKLRAASLGGEAMEDGDGEQPDQLLQSKGNTESNLDSKLGMEDALLDKGSEPLFESDSDIAVDKRTDSEINADLSEAEISDVLLCDGVINMLRKILDTKETREIVRQKTLKRPRSSNELEDKANNGVVPKAYSRCSVPYFVDVVKTTRKSQSKVDLVKGIGFAYLLELDDSVVPRHFTQWVADKVKNESETCYGKENHQWASTKRYSYLKAAIERTVGDTLNEKVKEDIYLSFQQHMREEGPNTCSKVKNLILEVIQIVTRATCDSEKTLKIDSSANQHNSTNHGHDSEATVKVNSNGEYEEEEDEDEQQALTDNGSSDWARYLDEARQKYFFYSDNVQTIRLFENQDDSGTKINEPELWRPLGMSSKEYENKIQVAKNNGPRKSNEQAKRSSNKLNVPCDWARYLDEAREKYFFYTDDIPTLRLFENEDDNGTEIREQELWRPLGMSSEEYEKKIQMAKNNGPHKRTKEADNIDFNEYFLQKWKNEASRLQWRDRLIKSFIGAGKARDLQLCNELFFPTIHRSHWFVFLVDLSARKFIFLDSKYDGEHTFHKEIKQMMVENFKQLWNVAGLRNMGFRHYEIAYPNLPKQDGDDACGIFVLKWLENWRSRNAMQTVFRQEDVQDARIRLAIDILFSQHNILTEGKRIVKDF
ncbi:hypothetical protein D1007_36841 [Hordeum vulgare]|nr:hypothetical protein D1007_36841 [Hordeum vulgare]